MRRLELDDYIVSFRNDQALAKFKDEKCECGLELKAATPLNLKVKNPDDASGECPECGRTLPAHIPEFLELPYHVKDSLIEMLLSRDNELRGRELLARDKIARRINEADGYILLEEAEWQKLVSAGETIKGVGRADVQLMERVFDAVEVAVEEKAPVEVKGKGIGKGK